MKYLVSFTVCFIATMSLYSANLTVVVTNIKNPEGNIIIGIFNKADSFPKEGKHEKQLVIPIRDNEVTITVNNLPDGEYALAILHDENNNNQCDFNIIGIPKEGVGFSNNFKPRLKAPKFKDVKFSLHNDMTMSIKLIYF